MSNNKLKYFEVVTTKVVRALNKTDALSIARSTRRASTLVNNISAADARELQSEV
jgi:hypothetical protein